LKPACRHCFPLFPSTDDQCEHEHASGIKQQLQRRDMCWAADQPISSLAHAHASSLHIGLPTADYASHLPPVGLAEGACDAMQWWASNVSVYRNTACIAISALQSELQFSAAGRHISRFHSRFDPDCVAMIIFLYKYM